MTPEQQELHHMLCYGPSIVVADEGHRLKNEDGFNSQCMELIQTRRRIVLTGYPLQNHLKECVADLFAHAKCNAIGCKQWLWPACWALSIYIFEHMDSADGC